MKSVMVMTDGTKIMYSPSVYIEHLQDPHLDEESMLFYVYDEKTRREVNFKKFSDAHCYALGIL